MPRRRKRRMRDHGRATRASVSHRRVGWILLPLLVLGGACYSAHSYEPGGDEPRRVDSPDREDDSARKDAPDRNEEPTPEDPPDRDEERARMDPPDRDEEPTPEDPPDRDDDSGRMDPADCDDRDLTFANASFEHTHTDGPCERPAQWRFADRSTGDTAEGHLCVATRPVSHCSRSVGIRWTGNGFDNVADLWQQVDLGGVSVIELDLLGPESGNPQRSDHLILIDGTRVRNCGYVENGERRTCTVDVSDYTGHHEFRHRWKQRRGDNLGNSKIDHVRALPH